MQRILQPGDIEALDRTQLPRIRLPQPASLFADRAARLAQKAEGNPIGDYLRFLARLVRAQQQAAGTVQTAAPDPALIAKAQEHSMALLPAAQHIDPAWQGVLDQLLAALDGAPELPEALRPTLARLRALSGEERDALARRALLGLLGDSADLAAAPIVMAALQVVFAYIGPTFGMVAWWAHIAGFVFGLGYGVYVRAAIARRLRKRHGF